MHAIRIDKTDNCFGMFCVEFIRRASAVLIESIVTQAQTVTMQLGQTVYRFSVTDLADNVSFLQRVLKDSMSKYHITLFFDSENAFVGFALKETKR